MKNIAIVLTLLISSFSMSQQATTPIVEVSGEGIVKVVPDEVIVNVRAEHSGSNAREVKQQNDNVINDVINFLKSKGIADKHIKTAYVRLGKNYDYSTKKYNYTANQSMSVKLVDLKSYDEIMNGLMESGINRIDNVQFSSSQTEKLSSEARKKAVENAKMKAVEYASVLGQEVGKAVTIKENMTSNVPTPVFRAMAMDEAGGGQQTLAPGEMEIRVTIYITFELK